MSLKNRMKSLEIQQREFRELHSVSAIIICLGDENWDAYQDEIDRYIEEARQEIPAQRVPKFEVWINDDGSLGIRQECYGKNLDEAN